MSISTERQHKLGRRTLLRSSALGSMGLAAAALVGCDDDDSSAANGDDNGTEPVSAGGTIRFGMLADLTSIEPHVFIREHNDSINNIWDQLTEYDLDLEPQPRLAEDWEINEDATEFVLHLVQGARWHSGREFTSEDIVQNFERVQDPDTGLAQLAAFANLYSEIEAPDEHTVIIRSDIPRPATFDFFENFKIGDPEHFDGDDDTPIGGTGPFMLGEWRPGERFNLVRNPDYWEEGVPRVDEIIFSVSLDPQTGLAQLESGALEILASPSVQDFLRLSEQPEYEAILDESPGAFHSFGFNTTVEPLNDVRARQALNWAIDRERFTSLILHDTVQPFSLPWPEESIAYEEGKSNHYQFDLQEARQLLDAVGVDNLNLNIIMNTNSPELHDFSEIYQADLAGIGVSLEIEITEVAVFVDRINADPPDYNGIWGSGASRANLGAPVTMINLTPVLFGTDGNNNTAYFSDEWADVIERINLEVDEDAQRDLYAEMNDLLLEESWIAFLAPRASGIIMQSNVSGVTYFPAREGFEFREVAID